MERTFVIIKPDAVQKGLIGAILQRFEQKGLKVIRLEMRQIERQVARQHYAHLVDKPFFEGVLDAITATPVVLGILEGPEAVSVVRTLVGPTNPAVAPPGTIRGDYAIALPDNAVHASDSPESATREIKLFFGR
ncbi:MAG: nucleoside-diphosphate kinase [Firmicutes bacterium]|nr:nucleoside-diphosphate kinase [Bacillota bacterium]